MKKLLKTISSAAILITLLLCSYMQVFAEEEYRIPEEERISLESDSVILATDQCGVSAVFELLEYTDGSHVLRIFGSGEVTAVDWRSLFREQGVAKASLILEEGITAIGSSVFDNCNFLTGPLVIPESVESIGYRAFYGCDGLNGRLEIPDGVKVIESYAFQGCKNFYGDMSFSKNLTSIGNYAFTGCQFPSYYLPAQITDLGSTQPFPKMVNGKDVTILALKDSYAYQWAVDHGYIVQKAEAKYTVTYASEGGQVDTAYKVVSENRPFGELEVPVREGYTFTGWYDAATDGALVTKNTICTGDLTIYAYWEANGYAVSFDRTGGTGDSDGISVVFDMPYGSLPVVEREHYSFDGWYTQEKGGVKITAVSAVKIASDHTLYAHWIGDTVPITLDKVGGTGASGPASVEFGAPYGTLPVLTKANCEFMGWYTSLSGGNKIDADTIVSNPSAHTLYARWQGIEVVVSFDRTGGQGFTPNTTLSYGGVYGILPIPVRADKEFDGWYTEEVGGSKVEAATIVDQATDHTLYAHWTAKHVDVSFDLNGGEGSIPPVRVVDGGVYGVLPTATREGYVFAGWYSALTGGTAIESDTEVHNIYNHKIYAHWTPISYQVTFHVNGGEGSYAPRDVDFGSNYGDLPVPVRTSYEFAGWYTQAVDGEKITSSTTVATAADHTIYAHWTGKRLTVSFDMTGGYGDAKSIRVNFDAPYGELPIIDKYGFTQTGWFTAPVGGSLVTKDSIVATASDHVLYAQWTPRDYTVKYYLSGGINDGRNPMTYQRSDYAVPLYEPTRNGYTFGGWYTTSNYRTGTLVRQIPRNLAQDLNLYAKWLLDSYKITYYLNRTGANNPNASKVKYTTVDSDYVLKPATQKGYVHLGWYLDPEFTQPIDKIQRGDYGDLKIYAQWRGAEYTVYYHGNGELGGYIPPSNHEYMKAGDPLSDGANFILPGYHVKAWYLNPECKGTKYPLEYSKSNLSTVDGSTVDLYAKWEANTYYVEYDPNGTTGRPVKSTFVYDRPSKIAKCKYSKTGYVFDCWNTEPDGSGTSYTAGQLVNCMTDEEKVTIKLYAQWKPIYYYISFAGNKSNGGIPMEQVKAYYDQPITLPLNTYARSGYTFKNWEGSVNRVKTRFADGETGVSNLTAKQGGIITLKAMWEYEYTLDPNGGVGTAITVEHNDADVSIRLMANPYSNPGHRFSGWAESPTGRVRYTNKATVKNIAGKTLYAIWE